MKLEGKKPELLLNFDEFVNVWTDVIKEYYARGISSDNIMKAFRSDSEQEAHFEMEYFIMLLVIAMRQWTKKYFDEKAKKKVQDSVVEKATAEIFGDNPEMQDLCRDLFEKRFKMMEELSPVKKLTGEEQIRTSAIGFARVLVSECTQGKEETFKDVIEQISVVFLAAESTFLHLSKNTILDGNGMLFGKYRFLVSK